jgi:hypothetical protein
MLLLCLPLLAYGVQLEHPNNLLQKPSNLTHVHTFSFGDTSFSSDLDFIHAKHCADIHLHFDSHMYNYADDSFKLCLSHSSSVPEGWFTNLRYTFNKMYEQYSYEWENMSMYDTEKYNRYDLYMSAKHSLDLYKADIGRSVRYFSEPMNHLSLSSDEQTALNALNQTGKNIDELKSSVYAIVNSYTTSIQSKSLLIKSYFDASTIAGNLFDSLASYYESNVTDILRKVAVSPTTLYTCQKGHYCPTETSSVACPAGTYLSTENHVSVYACIQCPLQTYSTSGAISCTTCTTNEHMGATACHLRSLGEVIGSMDASGTITENFYIAFDMTRQYISSTSTLSTLTQTATAASLTGSLSSTIQTLVSAGGTVESAYQSVLLGAFQSVYAGSSYVTGLENTDMTSAEVVAQTNLTAWSGPYINGSTNYNLTLTTNTWAIYYIDGVNDVAILSGTRNGKTLTGDTPSTGGMIEFPVSSALAYGYPVVTKDGTPIHSYTLK